MYMTCHFALNLCVYSMKNEQDEFGAKDYTKLLDLKLDHMSRPLWVVRFIEQYLVFWGSVMWDFTGSWWAYFLGGLFPCLQACTRLPYCDCWGECKSDVLLCVHHSIVSAAYLSTTTHSWVQVSVSPELLWRLRKLIEIDTLTDWQHTHSMLLYLLDCKSVCIEGS